MRASLDINLRTTQRDADILKFIGELEFVTRNSLVKLFFKKGISKGAVSHVMSRLRKKGLIKRLGLNSGEYIYALTQLGIDLTANIFPEIMLLNEVKSINFNLFAHNKDISEIRADLQINNQIDKWKTHNLIEFEFKSRGISSYIPDAIIESNNQSIVFEYERTQKSTKRMEQRLFEVSVAMSKISKSGKKTSTLLVTNGESIFRRYCQLNINNKIQIVRKNETINTRFKQEF